MINIPKACSTCEHKGFASCNKTGFYLSTQRKYPSIECDREFSGWVPRMGVWQRIVFWWKGGQHD